MPDRLLIVSSLLGRMSLLKANSTPCSITSLRHALYTVYLQPPKPNRCLKHSAKYNIMIYNNVTVSVTWLTWGHCSNFKTQEILSQYSSWTLLQVTYNLEKHCSDDLNHVNALTIHAVFFAPCTDRAIVCVTRLRLFAWGVLLDIFNQGFALWFLLTATIAVSDLSYRVSERTWTYGIHEWINGGV